MKKTSRTLGVLVLLVILAAGCGRGGSRQLTPVEESYRLMDQGSNAKAVLVLERELDEHPENDEARELLASAYVGLAGIDIYAIQDSFQDILFRRSLKDELLDKKTDAPAVPVAAPEKSEEEKKKDAAAEKEGAGERAIQKVDRALVDLQKIAVYLARFPQIPEEKWVYLEKALGELGRYSDSSDVAVYRILIRLVYLKSYVVQEVIRDDDFATKQWACTFDPSSLREGFTFVNEQIEKMRADVVQAVQHGAKKLAKADNVLSSVLGATNLTESVLVLNNSLTVQGAETRLRKTLGCHTLH